MRTILIAAQKGGAGKTTLARNLSVAAAQDGLRVLCLDLDPQGSLRAWWESRDADTPAMLDRDPAPHALKATLEAAKAQFDLCIIDTPPAHPEWLNESLEAADLVLSPVRPSPDDLRAVGATIAAVNAAKCHFVRPVSDAACADHRGGRPRPGATWPRCPGEYRAACCLRRNRRDRARGIRNNRPEGGGRDCRRVGLRERDSGWLRNLWPSMAY